MPEETNPLSEALVNSLDELFSRDPEDWSKQDRKVIVEAFRKQRARWDLTEKSGKKPSRKGTGDKNISLSDLGLDL